MIRNQVIRMLTLKKEHQNGKRSTEMDETELDSFIEQEYNKDVGGNCFFKNKNVYNEVLYNVNRLYEVPFEIIEKKMKIGNKKCWNFYNISVFDSIPFEYIVKNDDKNWNWIWLSSSHKDIMKLIYKYPEKINYREVIFNENLDLDYVDKFPGKRWRWSTEGMGSNPKINLKFLKKYKEKFLTDDIDGIYLQQNPNFDISWIYELPEFNWNMKLILEKYDLVKKT